MINGELNQEQFRQLPGKRWRAWPENPGENWKNNWRF